MPNKRLSLTLAPDVAAAVERESKACGISLSEAANKIVRAWELLIRHTPSALHHAARLKKQSRKGNR